MILAGAIEIPFWLIVAWLGLVVVVFAAPYVAAAIAWWPLARLRWPSVASVPTWLVAVLSPVVAGMVSLRVTDAAAVLWLAAAVGAVAGITLRLVQRVRRHRISG